MGAHQRRKGARGQSEAAALLRARGWQVDPITAGVRREDAVVTSPEGRAYSLEVKKQRAVNLPAFTAQARQQAKARRLPWALLAHLAGTSSWVFLRQGEKPELWSATDTPERESPLLGATRGGKSHTPRGANP